ncbi:hypothetical protein PYW08_006486 [Mythimna loreyi]|uniref:Uncharacterized protein n=1 Tax=Mythimna loreyi TaxID=667449 RepID=A0ACC2QPW1_9NEOP|nr:hypothetical protein PYW08_006486 [Mythimna loreyi]
MEKLRFKFEVQGSADGKTNVICITTIETPDGRVYEIPDELKPAKEDVEDLPSDVESDFEDDDSESDSD